MRCMEKVTWKLTLPYVKQPMRICCMTQETQAGALYQPRGRDGEGGGREGTCVYPWLIHVGV